MFITEEFRALAGLSTGTFRILFQKYCGVGTPIAKPVYLFVLFKYYKLYPVVRAWSTIFPGKRSRRSFLFRLRSWEVSRRSCSAVHRWCGSCLLALSNNKPLQRSEQSVWIVSKRFTVRILGVFFLNFCLFFALFCVRSFASTITVLDKSTSRYASNTVCPLCQSLG